MNIKQNNNKIEGFDGELLHPSLDIKNDILVLGFRYKAKSGKDEDLILVVRKGNIEVVQGESFVVEDKNYSLEKKGRQLIRIQERWNLADLNQFREDYANVQSGTIPEARGLFEEIRGVIERYVELEKEIDYWLVAAWVLGTYFHPAFSAYPFLNPKAPKRSGKSQLLNLLRQLCFNAVKARPTVAALGDTLDSLRGTYLIDQADSLGKKGTEELLDILADSYKRGGGKRRIMLIEKGKRQVLELETYSPKVFASIRELPEDLRDRCFIVPLIRSQRNFLDPDEESGTWRELRGKIYKFLLTEYSSVVSEYTVRKIEYKMSAELVGRTLELWLPFEAIFRSVGAIEKLEEAKKRFISQYGFSEYEPSDFERETVQIVLDKFGDNRETILSPKTISERVDREHFLPQITSAQIAAKVGWVIKKFNLSSEKKRSREGICYLFEKKKVESIYNTYFPTPPTLDSPNIENTLDSPDVGVGVGV